MNIFQMPITSFGSRIRRTDNLIADFSIKVHNITFGFEMSFVQEKIFPAKSSLTFRYVYKIVGNILLMCDERQMSQHFIVIVIWKNMRRYSKFNQYIFSRLTNKKQANRNSNSCNVQNEIIF